MSTTSHSVAPESSVAACRPHVGLGGGLLVGRASRRRHRRARVPRGRCPADTLPDGSPAPSAGEQVYPPPTASTPPAIAG
jgi:hypothetical protein